MDYRKTIRLYYDFVMPTYTKTPLVLERGRGTRVWDSHGDEYLDFFPGWAVSGIGHCHRRVTEALKRQVEKLMHVSNNYYHQQQAILAEEIIRHSFPGKVFFCNSGAEANEAAFKLARRFGQPNRYEIISMERSFHGRTFAAVTATLRLVNPPGPVTHAMCVRLAYVHFASLRTCSKSGTSSWSPMR